MENVDQTREPTEPSRQKAAKMSLSNWQALMNEFGFAPNNDVFDKLEKAHTASARHYHSDVHIAACLGHLYDVNDQVNDWKSLALAFWFHDAVYRPFKSDNERKSADWAVQFLKDNGADPALTNRVEALIMATCHNVQAADNDTQILIDIDLSILGTASHIYDVYESNIRKEYKRVPGFLYRKKRKALLQSFLDKPKIYGSAHFNDLLEEQARENLVKAIEQL